MTSVLTIDFVGAQGDGVADVDGTRVYVPGTLAGEQVEVEVDGDRGSLVRVLQPSPDRQTPPCRHFGGCGGCALQHMGDKAYGAWKTERALRALQHRGFEDLDIRPLWASPPASRRRARLTAINAQAGVVLGFNQRGTNRVFGLEECPVLRPEIMALLPKLLALLQGMMPSGKRGQVHLTLSETGLDVVLDLPGKLDLEKRERLAVFGEETEVARISWGEGAELVLEQRPPSVTFAGYRVKLPPAAFLQASAEAEQAMLADVMDIVNDAMNVADLFSGLGTFSLPLMAKTRVDAFDGNAAAIAALAAAGGDRLNAHVRDLFRRPLRPDELAHYGAVVIDPPRAGARAQIEQLAVSSVPVIAMVSCNPATFARDARTLVDGGYALEWVRPVDQFVWSAEVEMVAAFRRS